MGIRREYQIAGIHVHVNCPQEWMYEDDGVLSAFRAKDDTQAEHVLDLTIADHLAAASGSRVFCSPNRLVFFDKQEYISYLGCANELWSSAYMRVSRNGNRSSVMLKKNCFAERIMPKMVLEAMGIEHLLAQRSGILLHASFILWRGQAILFTAPSQSGKSTQADLWAKLRGAEIINGDRTAIRMIDDHAMAMGIPFFGSSGICKNKTAPLAAIVYLNQAPETTITPLSGLQAFRRIWEGCTVNVWDKDDASRAIDVVQQIAQSVPVYQLACTPDESAVAALERMLEKE